MNNIQHRYQPRHLENIPAHWRTIRLKYTGKLQLSNVDKKSVEGQEPIHLCNYVDVYRNEHINELIDFMSATATQAQIDKFNLKIGDVLLTKDSEMPDDIAVPTIVTANMERVLCGYHLAQLRPSRSNHGGFLARAISAKGIREQFHIEALGVTRYGLSYNALGNAMLPLPPLAEQQAISSFLDHETAKLDRLIAEKENLIRLLEEKRRAIISQTVTQGLNPKAKMTDSQIPWLGRIPYHWSLKKLKHLATVNDDVLSENTVETNEIAYVDIGSVNSYGVITNTDLMLFKNAPSRARRLVRDGDIIVSTVRTYLRAIAKIKTPPPNLVVSTGFAVVRPTQKINEDYLGFLLQSNGFIDEVVATSTGVSYPAITSKELMSISIPFPPMAEQLDIAAYLNQQMPFFNQVISECASFITLLRERRSALISAAVSGQLKIPLEAS